MKRTDSFQSPFLRSHIPSWRHSLAALAFICAIAVLPACSSDDDGADSNPPPASRPYPVDFDISGALSGSRSGSARVLLTEIDGSHSLTFSFDDATPSDTSSFSLSFGQGPSQEPIAVPAVGTYTLGGLLQDEDFAVVYSDTESGFSFLGETQGTLTITSSSVTAVEGTFAFTTASLTNAAVAITVANGTFKAQVVP